jgi:hypothetical protein
MSYVIVHFENESGHYAPDCYAALEKVGEIVSRRVYGPGNSDVAVMAIMLDLGFPEVTNEDVIRAVDGNPELNEDCIAISGDLTKEQAETSMRKHPEIEFDLELL